MGVSPCLDYFVLVIWPAGDGVNVSRGQSLGSAVSKATLVRWLGLEWGVNWSQSLGRTVPEANLVGQLGPLSEPIPG